MKVKNHSKSKIRCHLPGGGRVWILPGISDVDEKIWTKLQESPAFVGLVDSMRIEPIEEPPKPALSLDIPEIDWSDLE